MTLAQKVQMLHKMSAVLATIGAKPERGALHKKSELSAKGAEYESHGPPPEARNMIATVQRRRRGI
jgi:hypothetical protein